MNRPDICHFFSTNVLLGTIFLHMKVRKLWQKFRDKTAWITDLATKRHKLQLNPINWTEISPHVEKFSIFPQLSYMENWNFSKWQYFLHEYNSWYSWQIWILYDLCTKGNVKDVEIPALIVIWRINQSLRAERTHDFCCIFHSYCDVVPDITILHGCRWSAGLDCMLLIMQIEAA